MLVSTLLQVRNSAAVAHVCVVDGNAAEVYPPTPTVVVGNVCYRFADLPDDQGPLLALFCSDPECLSVVHAVPVEAPQPPPNVVVGAWMVREGLRIVAAGDPDPDPIADEDEDANT